jgi:hypothetical protein
VKPERWAERRSDSEHDLGACTLTEEEKNGYWLELHSEKFSLKFVPYITQNCWVFGLCPSSGIKKIENMPFQKLDLFLSSGEGRN